MLKNKRYFFILLLVLVLVTACGRITSSDQDDLGKQRDFYTQPPVIYSVSFYSNELPAPYAPSFLADVVDPDSQPLDLRYVWDFGDGTTSNAIAPAHSYLYQGEFAIGLTVLDKENNAAHKTCGTKVKIIGGNNRPNINFCSSSSITGSAGISLNFTAGVSDLDGDSISCSWFMGDGTALTGIAVSHAYQADGLYEVIFKAEDSRGAINSSKLLIGIGQGVKIPPVITAVSWDPLAPKNGESVSFSVQAKDFDGTILNYAWDFGDGAHSSAAVPQHSYAYEGTYLLKILVQDNDGLTAERVEYFSVDSAAPGE